MKTFMLFHGGHSYAVGSHKDIESFDTLAAAKRAFERRVDFDPYFPCVDESAEAWIWHEMPEDNGDLYPAKILKLGPRGGILMEVC